MKNIKEMDFNFKIFDKKSSEILEKESVTTTIVETLGKQANIVISALIVTVMTLFLLQALSEKKLDSLYLMISYMMIFLCKLNVTLQSITQAINYIKKKSLKNQIVNGFLNMGILVFLFKYDGFSSILNVVTKTLNLL